MAERSEAKNAKRSFASKVKIRKILTRSFASRYLLRFAQPFSAKMKLTINWSLYLQGLRFFFMTKKKIISSFIISYRKNYRNNCSCVNNLHLKGPSRYANFS